MAERARAQGEWDWMRRVEVLLDDIADLLEALVRIGGQEGVPILQLKYKDYVRPSKRGGDGKDA